MRRCQVGGGQGKGVRQVCAQWGKASLCSEALKPWELFLGVVWLPWGLCLIPQGQGFPQQGPSTTFCRSGMAADLECSDFNESREPLTHHSGKNPSVGAGGPGACLHQVGASLL